MTHMTFFLPDGSARTVEYVAPRSAMQVAVDNDVPGIIGECGGEMTCGTCHVYVHDPWRDRVGARSFDELELLDVVENPTNDSRLACQIKLTADLDGLEVEVAAS